MKKEIFDHTKITTAEALAPKDPDEKRLWSELEKAEKPLRTILKRMNRIVRSRFPDIDLQTVSSCSGHVQQNGKIAYEPIQPGMHRRIERGPHIFFLAPSKKVDPQKKQEIEKYFVDLFSQTIAQIPFLETDTVSLENHTKSEPESIINEKDESMDCYIFKFSFLISPPKNAFRIIRTFWGKLEEQLGAEDGLSFKSKITLADIKEASPRPGFINPK